MSKSTKYFCIKFYIYFHYNCYMYRYKYIKYKIKYMIMHDKLIKSQVNIPYRCVIKTDGRCLF